MKHYKTKRFPWTRLLPLVLGLTAFAACVPEAHRRPTLTESRLGQGTERDTSLRPGETRAEIVRVDPVRHEIHVRTDDSRRQPVVLTYDPISTRVLYLGREYAVENLEAGDLVAFETRPRSMQVDAIRVQEPVQARAGGATIARPLPPPRPQVIEGTVHRVDYDLGVFELRPRAGGVVTVSVPYNARPSEVESFRRLRVGDQVRLEGEFVNRESFHLLAFLSDPDRFQSRR